MSFKVYGAVLDYSESEGYDRCVLLALAEPASHDGVTWIKVGEGKDDEEPTICRRARVSKSTAMRAIRFLEDDLHELQIVKVRRGKTAINVYRVVVGPIAFAEVDYDRLPFALPHRFGEAPVEGVQLTPSTSDPTAAQASRSGQDDAGVEGVSLAPSKETLKVSLDAVSRCQTDALEGVSDDGLKVSRPRARAEENEPSRTPAAEPSVEPETETVGDPAAAEPSLLDSEVAAIVMALPGADAGSPKRIVRLAHDLPGNVFAAAVEKLKQRMAGGGVRNPVGLLVDFLTIARAERAAAFSAQLLAELGPAPMYVPAPWTVDVVKREEPDRYVRLMAKVLTEQQLRVALADHLDRLDELVKLWRAVRAGDEAEAERDTPEQARLRWVDRHAATDPLDDVDTVIDAWDDVDDVERQELHEFAATVAARATTTEAEAA